MKKPLISIIIPAYNEEKVIARLLESILNQNYKDIEIIVVDDSSTDNTVTISKKFTSNVYTRKHQERSVQRNFGAKKAKGKYLLFLDADMELSKNVLNECVDLCEPNNKIGSISIPEIPIAKSFWEKVKAHEREIYNLEGDKSTDAARFFPKGVFMKVNGYDEKITGPEDWDLPERVEAAGLKTGRIKSKIKHYERVPNPFKLARKKYYYGLKSHRYFDKHNINVISAKTIYFLRPVFYKNWRILVNKPILTIAMILMLTLEQIAGGMGYIIGKITKA